jgi:hypothetical protein
LTKVKQNREQHAATYDKAMQVYREEAIAEIEKLLADAKAGEIRHAISMTKPEKHLAEYDQAITMLEMSVDDVIELDEVEFAQYVMDKWSWATTFERSTVSYAAKFKG